MNELLGTLWTDTKTGETGMIRETEFGSLVFDIPFHEWYSAHSVCKPRYRRASMREQRDFYKNKLESGEG